MKKKLIITGISVISFVFLIFASILIYINTDYHNKHIDNFLHKVGINNTQKETEGENGKNKQKILTDKFILSGTPIALNNASNGRYERYKGGILSVGENMMRLYNASGKIEWETDIQLASPILKVSGNKILLFEEKGNRFELYNDEKRLYKKEIENKILNANVSSEGDVVLVTNKNNYKGAVNVYNKSGEEIFLRNFGTDNILSAVISDSRKLVVSLLSVDEKANSKIVFLDINKKNDGVSKAYEDTIIFDLDYSKDTFFAYGDNKIISFDKNGKERWIKEYSDKTLNRYRKNSNERLLLFDNNNNSEFLIVNSMGTEKTTTTDIIPNFCDFYNDYLLYNDERNLYYAKENGNYLAKYSSSRDIYKAYFIDSKNVLVVYNSSLEFLHIK